MPRDVIAARRGPAWYALALEPGLHVDGHVRRELRRADIEHYQPMEEYHVRRQNRSGRMVSGEPRLAPFLPGYLLVFVDLDRVGAKLIEDIKGAIRLVRGAMPEPTPIDAALVLAIRRLQDKDGVIRTHCPAWGRFKPGDQVRDVEDDSRIYEIQRVRRHDRIKVLFGGVTYDLPAQRLVAV